MEHDVLIIPAGSAELILRVAREDLFGNESIRRIVPLCRDRGETPPMG